MRLHSYSLLAFAVLGIAGCAPFPHQVTRTPEIIGTLQVASVPIAKATVLIGRNSSLQSPCDSAVPVGTTNERGEFHVLLNTETEIFYSFLNPPNTVGQLTNLCFQTSGESVFFGGQFLTKSNEPSQLHVVCDTTAQKQRAPLVGLWQICQISVLPQRG